VTQQLEDLEPVAAGAAPARTSPNLLQIVWQRKALVLLGLVVGLAVGAPRGRGGAAVYVVSLPGTKRGFISS
jgi:hypothetical protein